jgi:hypothetical protein
MANPSSKSHIMPAANVTDLPAILNRAKQEIESAATVSDAKEIRHRVEALRVYCRRAGEFLEMQNLCAEIEIRAERKAGTILSETDLNPGGRPSKNL